MNILLFGEAGQVGFELRHSLSLIGLVHLVGRSLCDLTQPPEIRSVIKDVRPDIIVNAAAYTAVDKAETEKDLAFRVNEQAPQVIGEEAKKIGALVIHYSTDYVFDGASARPYTETDQPNPLNVYGSSKRSGEDALLASNERSIVFRTSWVYGVHGKNFIKTILGLAKHKSSLNVVSDQWGAPTSAALIADVTAHFIRFYKLFPEGEIPHGIYHLTSGGTISWYHYAQHIIRRARDAKVELSLTEEAIKPVATEEYPLPAARPKNSHLSTQKLSLATGLRLPHWQVGIDHVLDQLLEQKI